MTDREVLDKLHKIQKDNIGLIDCHIETRKDMQCTQIIFSYCNYGFKGESNEINPKAKSKLYVHKFKWLNNNFDEEFEQIDKEIKALDKKYN